MTTDKPNEDAGSQRDTTDFTPLGRFVAVAGYDPQHHDEIKLTAGDNVVILHEYDDGNQEFLIPICESEISSFSQ